MRHIIAFSGGKDSAALGIYLKNKNPRIPYEFVMTDSGKELPETYSYIRKIEKAIKQHVYKIMGRTFDEWLEQFGGFLPSTMARWCTRELKIKPFEAYLGDDECTVYIGLRADENRGGELRHKEKRNVSVPLQGGWIGIQRHTKYSQLFRCRIAGLHELANKVGVLLLLLPAS